MQFSKSNARFSRFWLVMYSSACQRVSHRERLPTFTFPAIAASYTVRDKAVAIPYRADVGLLFYRTDLLKEYGYRAPPATWDELEAMATRIQAGERAKGLVAHVAADHRICCGFPRRDLHHIKGDTRPV